MQPHFLNQFSRWKDAIRDQYPQTNEVPLADRMNLRLSDGQRGTIFIFPSGKFVIQGSENSLDEFEGEFEKLKLQMEVKRLQRKTQQMRLEEEEELNEPDDSVDDSVPPP